MAYEFLDRHLLFFCEALNEFVFFVGEVNGEVSGVGFHGFFMGDGG